jgi:hypothetical protein
MRRALRATLRDPTKRSAQPENRAACSLLVFMPDSPSLCSPAGLPCESCTSYMNLSP